MPAGIDTLHRRLGKLRVEQASLELEKNASHADRLAKLGHEIAETTEDLDRKTVQWNLEKEIVAAVRDLKEKLEKARFGLEQARKAKDWGRAAAIEHGEIPQMERGIGERQAQLARVQGKDPFIREEVTAEDIARVVSRWTGIPVQRMLETEMDKLLAMEERLHERIVGQNEAVHVVANAIRRSRTGLADETRPMGTFLFLGPTGVGKTELARALAQFLFDDERQMIRLDMSEFMEKHTVARLVGAPPGYVGFDEGGQLTEAVRRKPYSVVLLDEIEKAHRDVFNVLLQVMDDGRLTDGHGRTVDFKNTVLVMTSNLGSELIRDLSDEDEKRRRIEALLGESFRPEFLNRIDDWVVFRSLGRDDIRTIVDLELAKLARRLEARRLSLEADSGIRDHLATAGWDPDFGARPLKRAIRRLVEEPLAREILAGRFPDGSSIAATLAPDSSITFTLAAAP